MTDDIFYGPGAKERWASSDKENLKKRPDTATYPTKQAVAEMIMLHQDVGTMRCSCGYYADDRAEHAARMIMGLYPTITTIKAKALEEEAERFRNIPDLVGHLSLKSWDVAGIIEQRAATIKYYGE